jgi:peptide-methionine (S)-S-oxide reductase
MFEKKDTKLEKATFAAGCFWGVEDIFMNTKGVVSTKVGYTGGHKKDPTYKDVCAGDTGHAEAVELEFDPKIISYKELLDVFWNMHDPTTHNRQGPDIGEQYRSAIFYHSEDQKKEAEASRKELNESGKLKDKVVTEITEASEFYEAEEYHQKYIQKNHLSSCHI